MAATEMNVMGILRVVEIFDALQDVRQIPRNMVFRNRINKVNASDEDIIARFLGQAHIADIVADDQKASTYNAGRIKFETTLIPNLKLGRTFSQSDYKRMEVLAKNRPVNIESTMYEEYFQNEARMLMLGIEMREETLVLGMYLDSFTYNRNGIILNLNWGMPAELKVTAGTAWTDHTNAVPVTDITTILLIAKTKYGKTYNRMTLSLPALNNLTACAQFQAQVRNFYINTSQPLPQIPLQSTDALRQLVGRVLNLNVELYDTRFPSHPTSGAAPVYSTNLPLGNVILDDSNDDNNNMAKDLASGIVTESTVGSQLGSVVGLSGPSFGPVSYATPISPDLNPPGWNWWAAERAMPRKKDLALSALLDAGAMTDLVSSGIAF